VHKKKIEDEKPEIIDYIQCSSCKVFVPADDGKWDKLRFICTSCIEVVDHE